MRTIKAPDPIKVYRDEPAIFLAGSIEMGTAIDWQTQVERHFQLYEFGVLLNPRRNDWDSSWEQKITNPQFCEQVEWELKAMEMADVIIMHFEPNTKSPITLLELGLHANSGKLIVHCPSGFWRKGNVDVVCERYSIIQTVTIEEACQQAMWMWRQSRI